MLAYVEKALYCGDERFSRWDVGDSIVHGPKVNVSTVRVVNGGTTQATAGIGRMLQPRGCFVSIKGTFGDMSSLMDGLIWMSSFDRQSCPGCKGHFGFLKSYESIKSGVFDALKELGCKGQPMFLTGHSMGAAQLTFLLYDLLEAKYEVKHMYAMESPRPGNLAFQKALGKMLKGVNAWRVSHFKDLVVHLPPRGLYYHALPEIYYTARNGTDFRKCGVEDDSCSNKWSLVEETVSDHEWYADIDPCRCSNASKTPPERAHHDPSQMLLM